ncbi:MAG: hypothetical protein JWQ62_802 [Lacunisphaera sp.]|nr:hypothetical protein [Lacunisphaera sp.]
MKSTVIHLVRLPEANREIALRAAREVFPGAQFVLARSVAEAALLPEQGRQLLVLGGADEAEISHAAATLDAGELPRWAVVCLGQGPSDLVEIVPAAEWTVPLLGRVFRAALMQHDLLCENLQLRGDLKTVSRRVSHDARTPLGCIHTICELLKDMPANNPAALEETTEAIRTSTAEVCLLVDRVSLVLKASVDPLPGTIVAMGAVVDHVLAQLRAEIEAAGKVIRQPTRWPEAEGVTPWLEVIWWNLVRNALVHGARSGAVQLGWNRDGTDLRFWVASQGTVPAAFEPRLLRRFNLLHQHPSAGFGLSVVQRLVALQGGRCGYETTDDSRAVFYFTLPPARPGSTEQGKPAASSRPTATAGSLV